MLTGDELYMATAGEGHLRRLRNQDPKDWSICSVAACIAASLCYFLGVQSNGSPCVAAELDNGNSYW